MKRRQQSDGLHEIKNKKRPRALKNKRRGGIRLGVKKMSGTRKAAVLLSGVLIIGLGGFGIGALFDQKQGYNISTDYGSVVYAVKSGEKFSPAAFLQEIKKRDKDGNFLDDNDNIIADTSGAYDGLDIFGRLNYTFMQQADWYGIYEGYVDTAAYQDVRTLKQYHEGILVSVDITKTIRSSIPGLDIHAAREFCYVKDQDRVLWREAAGGPSTYNGFDTEWRAGDPHANMYINYNEDLNGNGKLDEGEDLNGNGKLDRSFKSVCGLPAYELSVYVFQHDTILSVEEPITNEDGTYTITYHMNVAPGTATDEEGNEYDTGAIVYYANQMKFTGGLTDKPDFRSVDVTYTFTEDWLPLRCDIQEDYDAVVGFPVQCKAGGTTTYYYDKTNPPFEESDAYETYFKDYVFREATGPVEEVSGLNYLLAAIDDLFNGGVVLDLKLDLAGIERSGKLYLDVGPLINNLIAGGVSLDSLDLKGLEARITLGNELGVWLQDGVAYLQYGTGENGIKISMSVSELLSHIGGSGASEGATAPLSETDTSGDDADGGILAQLMEAFESGFTRDEEHGTAKIDFSLALADGVNMTVHIGFFEDEDGNVTLDKIALDIDLNGEAIGAEIAFADLATAPAALTEAQKDGFLEITPYSNLLAELFSGEAIEAQLSYSGDGLTVEGNLTLVLDGMYAQANLQLSYGQIDRTITLVYVNDCVYLTLDALKVRITTDTVMDAVTLLMNSLGASEDEAVENSDKSGENSGEETEGQIGKILETILSLDVGKFITVGEEKSVLGIILNGNALLSELGVKFELGDVTLNVSQGGVEVYALGVEIALGAGKKFDLPSTKDFVDMSPVIAKLPEIVDAEGVSFGGGLTVQFGDDNITLTVHDGYVSWAEGTEVYLDATLSVLGTQHDLTIFISEKRIVFVYGEVGVDVDLGELSDYRAAIDALTERINGIVSRANAQNNENILAEMDGIDELLGILEGAAAIADTVDGSDGFDWTGIVQSLEILPATAKNGILRISYGDFALELLDETGRDGLLALTLAFTSDSVSISGELHASAFKGELPAMPAVDYLDATEFAYLLDFIGAAIDTLAQQNVTITLEGSVTSADTEKYPTGIKYNISGSVSYYSGESFPIHIDTENLNAYINTDLFLHVQFALAATSAEDDSFYLDFTIFDGDSDGVLDFYVSVSAFAANDKRYDPLLLHAPADEIMMLLSSALSLVGADSVEILNNYVISRWLSVETVTQLRSLGEGLMETIERLLNIDLSSILGLFQSGQKEPDTAAQAIALADAQEARRGIIKAIISGEKKFEVTVDSSAIYDAEGIEGDITFTMTKDSGEDGQSYLTAMSLVNVYDKTGTEKTNVTLSFECTEVTPVVPDLKGYLSFEGVDALLLSIVKSATHEERNDYVLNENFYIEGSAGIDLALGSLDLISVDIETIAVSVTLDKNDEVTIHIHLDYQGNYSSIAALAGLLMGIDGCIIKGDSTVDITILGDMIYIKRVQTSDTTSRNEKQITPVTLYRAMPLSAFMDDIFNQMQFIFNFGDKLWSFIQTQIASSSSDDTAQSEEVLDFGGQVKKYLADYSYTPGVTDAETGKITKAASWNVSINGDALAEGVLDNLNIGIYEDVDGFIHNLIVSTGIISIIKAQLNLTWYNPGGVMPDWKADQTDSTVASSVVNKTNGMGGMLEKLDETGWAGQIFLEAEEFTVTYVVNRHAGDTASLGEQQVLVSTGADGNAARTLYGELGYAAFGEHENEEFYCEWLDAYRAGDVLPADGRVYARQNKQLYSVTFVSEDDLGEYWTRGGDGLYYRTFEMEYGAAVTFMANGAEYESYTVTGDCTITLPEKAAYVEDASVEGRWGVSLDASGAVFTVLYELHTVTYKSEVAFNVDGQNYTSYDKQFKESTTLIAPSVDGYTFLGWYMHTAEGGWEQVTQSTLDTLVGEAFASNELLNVTIEALWAAGGWIKLEASKQSAGTLRGENYSASASVDNTKLMGAMANELTLSSAKFAFVFNTNASGASYGAYADSATATSSRGLLESKYTNAHVKAQVVYTLSDGTSFTFEHEQHEGM